MKKAVTVFVAVLLLSLAFITGCYDAADTDPAESVDYVTVTFDSDGGTAVEPIRVKRGDKITSPEVLSLKSTLENPVIFDGWYLGNEMWDFEQGVEENMTLAAHWKSEGKYTVPVIPED